MTTYARCIALLDAEPIGTYTVGKEYPLHEPPMFGCYFTIKDDEGDIMPCWWDGSDCDCIWERIER